MRFFEEQIERTSSYIARINWISVTAMIALLLTTSLLQKKFGTSISNETAAKVYLAAISLAVISLPLANWLYNKGLKRLIPNNPLDLNLRLYVVGYVFKLAIVSIAFALNLIFLFLSGNSHLLIIGAIYIVYQMVALQSKETIIELVGVQPVKEKEEVTEDAN